MTDRSPAPWQTGEGAALDIVYDATGQVVAYALASNAERSAADAQVMAAAPALLAVCSDVALWLAEHAGTEMPPGAGELSTRLDAVITAATGQAVTP